jgi:deoxyribonuclease-4
MQIYVANSRSYSLPKFDYKDLMLTRKILHKYQLYLVIHGSLLYNLAGKTTGKADPNYHQSLSAVLQGLTSELDYGVLLNAGIVVHPGSQKNSKEGLETICESIEKLLTRQTDESEEIAKLLGITQQETIKKRKIILENAAGEGTKLCSTLEEIAFVISGVKEELRDQIRVCIDTAHLHGRGQYDLGKKGEIKRFYKDFDKIIGLKYLEVFHFNDSKVPLNSRKDRHEQLGEGHIFKGREEQIKTFMLQARKYKIKIIGEPPVSGLQDWITVAALLEHTKYPLVEIIDC